MRAFLLRCNPLTRDIILASRPFAAVSFPSAQAFQSAAAVVVVSMKMFASRAASTNATRAITAEQSTARRFSNGRWLPRYERGNDEWRGDRYYRERPSKRRAYKEEYRRGGCKK